MRAALATAHARWCSDWVEPEVFARHVRARLPAGSDPDAAIEGVCAADLYLACACEAGRGDAVAAFVRTVLRPLRPMLRGMGLPPADAEDLEQELLCVVVLPGRGGSSPKITQYRGRGSLARWCRVVAARLVLQPRTPPPTGVVGLAESPSRRHEVALYRRPVGKALAEAVADLTPRERRLLQLSIIDRVKGRSLARMFGVHESTVSRWLAIAKTSLGASVRARLQESLGTGASEVESILRGWDEGFETSTLVLWPAPPG